MRSHREIEIKLRVDDPRDLRGCLRKLGAVAGRAEHEVNTLFDTPGGALRKRGHLLRLRRIGRRAIVTWKGPSQRSAPGAVRYKVREEREWEIGQPRSVAALLRELARRGLRPSFVYEKQRIGFRLPSGSFGGLKVLLDHTPIGDFLELEGPRRQIDRAARLLGYAPADYLTSSYAGLYLSYCRRHGRRPSHMLFPHRRRLGPARRKK